MLETIFCPSIFFVRSFSLTKLSDKNEQLAEHRRNLAAL